MRRLAMLAALAALAVPAQAQNIQAESVSHDTPYVAGSIYSTLTSFDGNIGGTTEPAFLASLVGRLPLGSRLAFALRLDSQPQSGQVPFGSLDTWYSGQLAASTSFEFSRGERWQAGVHATGALTYALSDLEGQFGRSLDARPKLWFAGPYLRDSANGAFAYAGIGKDQVAAGDGKWTMFATVTVPFLETSTIRIDVTIPLGTEAVPHAGRLVAGIGIPVFSRRAGQ